jgi:hypothetical protein
MTVASMRTAAEPLVGIVGGRSTRQRLEGAAVAATAPSWRLRTSLVAAMMSSQLIGDLLPALFTPVWA